MGTKRGLVSADLIQLLFPCYPNSVIDKNSGHQPRSVDDAEGPARKPEGGRFMMVEGNMCICRHKR